MSISSKEFKIQRKYKELPEQPRYKKKKKKVSVKRSNHKHIYHECLFSFNNFRINKLKSKISFSRWYFEHFIQ